MEDPLLASPGPAKVMPAYSHRLRSQAVLLPKRLSESARKSLESQARRGKAEREEMRVGKRQRLDLHGPDDDFQQDEVAML
eukprot:14631-Eustigmatos_ZCMA.PRE.1